VLVLLAFLIFRSDLPAIDKDESDVAVPTVRHRKSVFEYPHVMLGVFTLFLYVGVEVMAGDTIISYGLAQGIPFTTAKLFTTGTLVAMVAGYIVGTFAIPRYISQQNTLKISAILGLVFTVAAISTHGYISVTFIAMLGLANSLMWPAIWPLTLEGLGRHTKAASSLLIMGISGGAIIPLIYGGIIDYRISLAVAEGMNKEMATASASQQAYLIMIPCYLMIYYYAAAGHRLGRVK
jgi:FHS family L-fucose permease-like MFS transporter